MKDFLRYTKNRILYNILRFFVILGLGILLSNFINIQKVYADTVSSYYVQDTSSTKSTDWNPSGSSGNTWTYTNQHIIFSNDSERYVTISTCLTGNLDMTITQNINGSIAYQSTTVGSSCDVQGYSGAMYYFIFYVNDFYDAGNGNSAVYFNLKVTNNNTYKVVQDIFNVTSSASRPTFENYDDQFNDINNNLGDINDSINDTNEKIEETNDKLDQAEETRKGIWETIIDLPGTIIDFLINALKSLFIPSDGFYEEHINKVMDMVEKQLGFLATPFTLIIDFLNKYLELNPSKDIIINIPDITVPNFESHKIISATTFNWSQTLKSKESLNTLWTLYLDFIDVFLILNFISLCERIYNRIFGGDTSAYEYYTVEDSVTYDHNTGEVQSARRNERTTTRKKVGNK